MKKLLSLLLIVIMMMSTMVTTFASTVEETDSDYLEVVEFDVDDLDLYEPFSYTTTFIDDIGQEGELNISFTPSLSRDSASVGTWEVWTTGYTPSQSYDVDMVQNGTGWKLENARNHSYSGAFMKFPSSSLTIGRASSTANFPAEVTGSVNWEWFDTTWVGPVASGRLLLTLKVSHSGTVTSSVSKK